MNCELPHVQPGFRKGRGTRYQIINICWIIVKARELQKNIYFCFIDYAKSSDCVDHKKLWKILKEMDIADHFTCLLRNLYAGQEAIELDMEQQTGSKSGKEYIKGCIVPPAYLTYMQSTSWEMLGWMKHSWKEDCREKYQYPQICRRHHPYGKKQIRTKEPLDDSEREEWKSWLKAQHSEN